MLINNFRTMLVGRIITIITNSIQNIIENDILLSVRITSLGTNRQPVNQFNVTCIRISRNITSNLL